MKRKKTTTNADTGAPAAESEKVLEPGAGSGKTIDNVHVIELLAEARRNRRLRELSRKEGKRP